VAYLRICYSAVTKSYSTEHFILQRVTYMYDKRLDAVMKAADLGSFSKAARELGYSIPALIKQINGFESQVGVTVFDRSNKGVSLTPGGRVLVQEARKVVEKCDRAVQMAKRLQAEDANTVRLGVSLYQSGQRIIELCRDLYLHGTDLSIKFVPMPDSYDAYKHAIANMGEEVDVLATGRLHERDERGCCMTVLEWQPLCFAVPISDELAMGDSLQLSALAHRRVHVPVQGYSYIDAARDAIAREAPGVELVEFPNYDASVFDECAQSGEVMLSSEFWSGAHPLLASVSVAWDKTMPYCLYYAEDPRPAVAKFVEALRGLVAAGC
jgi:DNA-binding transcriptional LysR family regulator